MSIEADYTSTGRVGYSYGLADVIDGDIFNTKMLPGQFERLEKLLGEQYPITIRKASDDRWVKAFY